MKNYVRLLVVTALLLLGTSVSMSQEPAAVMPRLTNKEVLEMVKGGLSSDVIIAKIKVSRCTFDTEAGVLSELKYKGVPNAVILAMVEAPYGMPAQAKERVEPKPASARGSSNIGGMIINDAAETSKTKGPSLGRQALEGKLDNAASTAAETKMTRADTLIPQNSTVFVDEMEGFEHYLMAAMRKKSVPLIVVADPMKADFIIFGNADSKRAGWAKMFFLGSGRSGEMASMTMVNRKTKVVVFSDSSYRYNANRGKRSTAEKLAKYLGKKIKEDQKKLGG
jgi:hypothetical protein